MAAVVEQVGLSVAQVGLSVVQMGLSVVQVGVVTGAVVAGGEHGKTQEPHTHTPPTSPSSHPHITFSAACPSTSTSEFISAG